MEATQTAPRSTFVTVVAWIFIVLSGFTTIISLLQNIMIAILVPLAEIQAAFQKAASDPGVPPMMGPLMLLVPAIFVLFLVVSAGTFVSAIGLLKRKNWARLMFIGFLGFGIAWNVAGTAFMTYFFTQFPQVAHRPPAPGGKLVMALFLGFNLLFVLAFIVLFAWIIKRLLSEEIRREFGAA